MGLIRVRFRARVSGLSMAGARLPPLLPPLLLLLSTSNRNPASRRHSRCCRQRCSHYVAPTRPLANSSRARYRSLRRQPLLVTAVAIASTGSLPALSLTLDWFSGFRVLWGTNEEEEQGERQGVEQRGWEKGKWRTRVKPPLCVVLLFFSFYFWHNPYYFNPI